MAIIYGKGGHLTINGEEVKLTGLTVTLQEDDNEVNESAWPALPVWGVVSGAVEWKVNLRGLHRMLWYICYREHFSLN